LSSRARSTLAEARASRFFLPSIAGGVAALILGLALSLAGAPPADAASKLLKPKLLQVQPRIIGQPSFAPGHADLCRDVAFAQPMLQAKCNAPLRDVKGKFTGPTNVVSQLDTTPCPGGPIYVGLDGALSCTDPLPQAPPFAGGYAKLCRDIAFDHPLLQAKCNSPQRDKQGKFTGPTNVVSQLDTSACPGGPIYIGLDGALTCTNPSPPAPPFAQGYAKLCRDVAFADPMLQAKCNAPQVDAKGKFLGPTNVVSQLDTTACPNGPVYVGLDGTLTCTMPDLAPSEAGQGMGDAKPLLKSGLLKQRLTPSQ
jgi:hypothetical protein